MIISKEDISIRETKIRVIKKGSGSPLIYLHGYNYDFDWHSVLDELSNQYTVYRLDYPGFNFSESNESIDSVQDLAFFILDFIDKLELNDITLMGSSLGGWLAMEISAISPEKIAKLILIDSFGIRVEGIKLQNIFRMNQNTIISKLFTSEMLQVRTLDQYSNNKELEQVILQNNISTAHLAWNPYFHNPKLLNLMHRLRMPIIVIWGSNDQILPLAYGEKLQELLPHSILKTVDGASHLPHIEKPNEFLNIINNFFG